MDKCGSCGKNASEDGFTLKECTACKAVGYCGKECQTAHWKTGGHRTECKKMQRGIPAAVPEVAKKKLSHDEARRAYEKCERILMSIDDHEDYSPHKERFAEMFSLLRKSAKSGCERASALLGELYENKKLPQRNMQKAVKWYNLGVDQGSTHAMNNLGVLYRDGEGVKLDIDKAAQLFEMGRQLGDEQSMENLFLLNIPKNRVTSEEHVEKMIPLLEQLDSLDNFVGTVNLGKFYLRRFGRLSMDRPRALALLRKAINIGKRNNMGSSQLEVLEKIVKELRPRYDPLLGQKVTLHGIKSTPELNGLKGKVTGFDADKGRYIVQVSGQRVLLLQESNISTTGVPKKEAALFSELDEWTEGEPVSHSKAAELLEKATKIMMSIGVNEGSFDWSQHEKKLGEAIVLVKKAARAGHEAAQYNLGVLYYSKFRNTKADSEEAVKWFTKASGQGNAGAMLRLARMIRDGEGGVEKDVEQAIALFERSAKLGNLYAAMGLGTMQFNGTHGFQRDPRRALEIYSEAVDSFSVVHASEEDLRFVAELKSRIKELRPHYDPLLDQAVTLCGLKSKPELNGCKGVVSGYDAEKDRYTVLLDGDADPVVLRSTNMLTESALQAKKTARVVKLAASEKVALEKVAPAAKPECRIALPDPEQLQHTLEMILSDWESVAGVGASLNLELREKAKDSAECTAMTKGQESYRNAMSIFEELSGRVTKKVAKWEILTGKKEFRNLQKLLLKAAADGHPEALYRLGSLYGDGILGATTGKAGTTVAKVPDTKHARIWWEKAASFGHLRAQERLASSLTDDIVSTLDTLPETLKFLTMTFENGSNDLNVFFNLGVSIVASELTSEKISIEQMYKAKELLEHAFSKGLLKAKETLAKVHHSIAVYFQDKDEVLSMRMHAEAARHGDPEALYSLGARFARVCSPYTRITVEKDMTKAMALWFQAARFKHGRAMLQIGSAFANDRNWDEAEAWYRKTASESRNQKDKVEALVMIKTLVQHGHVLKKKEMVPEHNEPPYKDSLLKKIAPAVSPPSLLVPPLPTPICDEELIAVFEDGAERPPIRSKNKKKPTSARRTDHPIESLQMPDSPIVIDVLPEELSDEDEAAISNLDDSSEVDAPEDNAGLPSGAATSEGVISESTAVVPVPFLDGPEEDTAEGIKLECDGNKAEMACAPTAAPPPGIPSVAGITSTWGTGNALVVTDKDNNEGEEEEEYETALPEAPSLNGGGGGGSGGTLQIMYENEDSAFRLSLQASLKVSGEAEQLRLLEDDAASKLIAAFRSRLRQSSPANSFEGLFDPPRDGDCLVHCACAHDFAAGQDLPEASSEAGANEGCSAVKLKKEKKEKAGAESAAESTSVELSTNDLRLAVAARVRTNRLATLAAEAERVVVEIRAAEAKAKARAQQPKGARPASGSASDSDGDESDFEETAAELGAELAWLRGEAVAEVESHCVQMARPGTVMGEDELQALADVRGARLTVRTVVCVQGSSDFGATLADRHYTPNPLPPSSAQASAGKSPAPIGKGDELLVLQELRAHRMSHFQLLT